MADIHLRRLRIRTHTIVDILWKTGIMSRKEMYIQMSYKLKIDLDHCHISYFGIDECVEAMLFAIQNIDKCFTYIKTYSELDEQQIRIVKNIVQNECDVYLKKFTAKDIKNILYCIFEDIMKIKSVNLNVKKICTISIIFNKELHTMKLPGYSIADYVKSFTNSIYSILKK